MVRKKKKIIILVFVFIIIIIATTQAARQIEESERRARPTTQVERLQNAIAERGEVTVSDVQHFMDAQQRIKEAEDVRGLIRYGEKKNSIINNQSRFSIGREQNNIFLRRYVPSPENIEDFVDFQYNNNLGTTTEITTDIIQEHFGMISREDSNYYVTPRRTEYRLIKRISVEHYAYLEQETDFETMRDNLTLIKAIEEFEKTQNPTYGRQNNPFYLFAWYKTYNVSGNGIEAKYMSDLAKEIVEKYFSLNSDIYEYKSQKRVNPNNTQEIIFPYETKIELIKLGHFFAYLFVKKHKFVEKIDPMFLFMLSNEYSDLDIDLPMDAYYKNCLSLPIASDDNGLKYICASIYKLEGLLDYIEDNNPDQILDIFENLDQEYKTKLIIARLFENKFGDEIKYIRYGFKNAVLDILSPRNINITNFKINIRLIDECLVSKIPLNTENFLSRLRVDMIDRQSASEDIKREVMGFFTEKINDLLEAGRSEEDIIKKIVHSITNRSFILPNDDFDIKIRHTEYLDHIRIRTCFRVVELYVVTYVNDNGGDNQLRSPGERRGGWESIKYKVKLLIFDLVNPPTGIEDVNTEG